MWGPMARITLINRVLSLLVCLFHVLNFDFATRGALEFLRFALLVCVPLSLIWYGEAIGSYVPPPQSFDRITVPTPGWLVAAAGWFFLVGLPLIAHWAKNSA